MLQQFSISKLGVDISNPDVDFDHIKALFESKKINEGQIKETFQFKENAEKKVIQCKLTKSYKKF